MPIGSSKGFRDQMRSNLVIESLVAAVPKPISVSKVVSSTDVTPTLVPQSTSITTVSYLPTPVTALIDVTALTSQGLINGYSFFSNITNKNVLVRELITSGGLTLLCMAQLGLAIYYFFANIDCSTESSQACKAGLFLSALKIGLAVFASVGSELAKRPFAEEEAIREEEAERRAMRRNRRVDPFFAPQPHMVVSQAHVIHDASPRELVIAP